LILLAGVSILDLGYEEMSLQLEYDLLEIKVAHMSLERGKMPDAGGKLAPPAKKDGETPREWNWK
jgi:hypothetical protein